MSTAARDEHRAGRSGPDARVGVGEEHDRPGGPAERRERRCGADAAIRLGRGEVLLDPGLDTQVARSREGQPGPGRGLADASVLGGRPCLGRDPLTGDRLEVLQRGIVVGLRFEEARERGDADLEVVVLRRLTDGLELVTDRTSDRQRMEPIAA